MAGDAEWAVRDGDGQRASARGPSPFAEGLSYRAECSTWNIPTLAELPILTEGGELPDGTTPPGRGPGMGCEPRRGARPCQPSPDLGGKSAFTGRGWRPYRCRKEAGHRGESDRRWTLRATTPLQPRPGRAGRGDSTHPF